MSKEYLEALERLYCSGNLQLDYVLSDKHKLDYEIVEQGLQRLEAIDNANPSEGLECLDNLAKGKPLDFDNVSPVLDYHYLLSRKEINTIKQALLKAQELEKENGALKLRVRVLEEDLEEQSELAKHYLDEQEKVLNIIKEKNVSSRWLKYCDTVDLYNKCVLLDDKLTQEEFELLKEYSKR